MYDSQAVVSNAALFLSEACNSAWRGLDGGGKMIYQLFVDEALVAKGFRTLAEAMAYAEEGICNRRSCRIIAIGYAATFPIPINEWRYDYDMRDWLQSVPEQK